MTREEAIREWTFRSNHIKKWLDEYGEEPSIRHYVELIDMAIEALQTESEWIPVSDRLPSEHICDDGYVEPSEKVLVCTDSGTLLTSRFWGNRQSKAEDPDRYADWVDIDWWHNVVAWMPLPEPYRGGDDE